MSPVRTSWKAVLSSLQDVATHPIAESLPKESLPLDSSTGYSGVQNLLKDILTQGTTRQPMSVDGERFVTTQLPHTPTTLVIKVSQGNSQLNTVKSTAATKAVVVERWLPNAALTSMSKLYRRAPNKPSNAVIGIIVGCVLALVLLIGVGWVYWLHLHQLQRKRSRSRSRKSSPAGSSAPPPPPDPPAP